MPVPERPRKRFHRKIAEAIANPFNSLILGPGWKKQLEAHSRKKRQKKESLL